MTFFLKLKHWQLFSLITFTATLSFMLFAIGREIENKALLFIAFPVALFFYITTFYGWLYSIAIFFYKRLQIKNQRNLLLFKIALSLQVIFAFLFILNIIINSTDFNRQYFKFSIQFTQVIFPLMIICLIGAFYCLWYVAKTIKSMELNRTALFDDFVGEFFLLCFFYLGIWILQPKINKLFNKNSAKAKVY